MNLKYTYNICKAWYPYLRIMPSRATNVEWLRNDGMLVFTNFRTGTRSLCDGKLRAQWRECTVKWLHRWQLLLDGKSYQRVDSNMRTLAFPVILQGFVICCIIALSTLIFYRLYLPPIYFITGVQTFLPSTWMEICLTISVMTTRHSSWLKQKWRNGVSDSFFEQFWLALLKAVSALM